MFRAVGRTPFTHVAPHCPGNSQVVCVPFLTLQSAHGCGALSIGPSAGAGAVMRVLVRRAARGARREAALSVPRERLDGATPRPGRGLAKRRIGARRGPGVGQRGRPAGPRRAVRSASFHMMNSIIAGARGRTRPRSDWGSSRGSGCAWRTGGGHRARTRDNTQAPEGRRMPPLTNSDQDAQGPWTPPPGSVRAASGPIDAAPPRDQVSRPARVPTHTTSPSTVTCWVSRPESRTATSFSTR
jgi:hypothetical protein